jgi:hypothetical protein
MPLLPLQPAPVDRRAAYLTGHFLLPAAGHLGELFLELRNETDRSLPDRGSARYGRPYPYGYCREITIDVMDRLAAAVQVPRSRGARAINAYLRSGGEIRRVWGALRDRYFQNAIQFGSLYVDVSNDTVDRFKPKIEILPMRDCGLAAIEDAWHFARIAETYWGMRAYANHAMPSLAPVMPIIGLLPGGRVHLESSSSYMVGLFRLDGYRRAVDWLEKGPPPPACVVEALRRRHPAALSGDDAAAGADAAIRSCTAARTARLSFGDWKRKVRQHVTAAEPRRADAWMPLTVLGSA